MSSFRKPTLAPATTVQDWAAQADAAPTSHSRPWLDVDPDRVQPFPIRMPLPLHTKLMWLKANLPGGPSLQKQALQAIESYADALIAQLEEERHAREQRS